MQKGDHFPWASGRFQREFVLEFLRRKFPLHQDIHQISLKSLSGKNSGSCLESPRPLCFQFVLLRAMILLRGLIMRSDEVVLLLNLRLMFLLFLRSNHSLTVLVVRNDIPYMSFFLIPFLLLIAL